MFSGPILRTTGCEPQEDPGLGTACLPRTVPLVGGDVECFFARLHPHWLKIIPSDTERLTLGNNTCWWAQCASQASGACEPGLGPCQLKEPLSSNRTACQNCPLSGWGPGGRNVDAVCRGPTLTSTSHPQSLWGVSPDLLSVGTC